MVAGSEKTSLLVLWLRAKNIIEIKISLYEALYVKQRQQHQKINKLT